MDVEKRFDFDGTQDRDESKDEVIEYIAQQMGLFAPYSNGLATIVTEIVKNIFDHADGRGFLILRRQGDVVEFEAKDMGEDTHQFDELLGVSRLAGNGRNFGLGLKMLRPGAEFLGLKLDIDTSRGFHYKGVLDLSNKQARPQ